VSVSLLDLLFYAGAICLLFLTPGPVWVALIARALSGGFHSAWPLALGVVIGDVLWPLVAIFGVSYLVSVYADFMVVLKFIGVIMFITMGVQLLRKPVKAFGQGDGRLTRPGMWAGFIAGVLVILANPKAILFYLGVLPGFFDLSAVTPQDIIAICVLSMIVPLVGNLCFSWFIDKIRGLVTSPSAMRRMNLTAGGLLVVVGLILPFT